MPHNRGNSGNKDKQKQTSEVLNESRETLYGTDRPNDPLSNSMFFQFMTRLYDRLKTIETNVTKSVGELDDIKKTVRTLSQFVHLRIHECMNTLQFTTSNKGFQVSGLAFKTSKLQV
jgi:hypothetical protein